jgi:hypothetical protein
MNFRLAYLEETGSGRLRVEETLVRSEFERRGIDVVLYTKKRILRRQLPLTRDDFLMGDIDAMDGAMKQLGIEPPAPDDFPDALAKHLHRKIWRSTVGDVARALSDGDGFAAFVKPAGRRKVFTGRVLAGHADLHHIGGISRHEPVWCSEIVTWVSEYRVFVVGSAALFVDHYAGDASAPIDRTVVDAAVAAYADSGTAPAGYGIDFGVLGDGRTALVEANDGFALGAYHVDARSYTDVLVARWTELLASARI